MAKVGFIGLGVMGYPMAGHLQRRGHAVTVYNRSPGRATDWLAMFGGVSAPTPCACARDQDIVFACVGNDNDLRSVTLGENGAFAGLKVGSIFVDHTTTSAGIARELHAIANAAGKGYVDAPVSGGQSGAENGTLTVMCGGTTNDFARVAPAISAYAQTCRLMGAVGSGQLTKMTNQICLAGLSRVWPKVSVSLDVQASILMPLSR